MRKKREAVKWAVVTDFDATVTTFDIGDSIVLHFGAAGAREVRDSYRPGVMVEKWMADVFRRLSAGPEDIKNFVLKTAVVRKGFPEFARLCRRRGVPLEIVSGGLDIYAAPIFAKWGIRVKSFFGRARWSGGKITVSYPFLKKLTLEELKASRVMVFKKKGYNVVFLGDGTSDYPAACSADVVFSRRKLHLLCRENKVKTKRLRDFHAVSDFLSREISGM